MPEQERPAFDDYFVGTARRIEPAVAARTPSTPPRRAPRGRGVAGTAAVVVLAITVGAVAARTHAHGGVPLGHGEFAVQSASAGPTEIDVPDRTRILPSVTAPDGSGGYTVLDAHNGTPVAWDPCEPIHFVVRPDGAVQGGRLMLDQAMAEVSKDTGLVFMDDGSTDEAPSLQRSPFQKSRYGDKWAPVLIAWSNPQEVPKLAGNVVGLGGPVPVRGKDSRNVSGEVIFDAPDLTRMLALPDGATYVRDVILHELGHLIGLGHVDDQTEVMNPVALRALAGYGAGDLRGLAALGAGRCFAKATAS